MNTNPYTHVDKSHLDEDFVCSFSFARFSAPSIQRKTASLQLQVSMKDLYEGVK